MIAGRYQRKARTERWIETGRLFESAAGQECVSPVPVGD
jgi:hypothetical protein